VEGLIAQYPSILLVMLLLGIGEYAWVRRRGGFAYDGKAAFASLGVAIGQFAVKPLSGGLIFAFYLWLHSFALWQFPTDDWCSWAACFLAVEFAYYWMHRWSHTVHLLWATHAVHHSSNQIILPVAIRLGWTGALSGGWLVLAPLALFGFPPKMIIAMLAINLFYQFGLHTEAVRKLGPLEWVLNTPSHHRAHHSSDEKWLDCNFGGVLIIFDRLFGTFVAEPDKGGLRYGLTNPIDSNNPFTIAMRQWWILGRALSKAKTPRDGWRACFGKP
jgi:sterol desaturase/sphingolipid hydroxylase (fatty acid hydroxylase superfamily)